MDYSSKCAREGLDAFCVLTLSRFKLWNEAPFLVGFSKSVLHMPGPPLYKHPKLLQTQLISLIGWIACLCIYTLEMKIDHRMPEILYTQLGM